MSYDAIVVGAGPAGLMFSRKLAEKGFRVAVIEKNETLAVKPCGEGISARVLQTAEVSKSDAPRFVSRPIKGAAVVAPNGKEVLITEKGEMGYVIDKRNFLRVMAEYAASKGADIFMREPAREVTLKDGKVRVNTRTLSLEAPLLVGADGYLSFVAKTFNLEKAGERKVIPAIQYVMTDVKVPDPELTYFYLGNSIAPKGYVWIFPKDGTLANVGIGVQGAAPKSYLDKFIKVHPEMFSRSKIIEFRGAAVTIGGMLSQIVQDHVVLIGEAAGQVIPLTGGGIHTSIAGGKIAAEVSAEALESGDLSSKMLRRYVDKYNEYWGKRIRDSLKALNVIEKLSDDELNQLADILSPEDVVNLANGENITSVAAKLLKHPIFSIKLAKALLS
ncbi:NAD(P)/FAD-dependent oxidoreductase [Infirmifilum sp. NZ]|uniref:NAD(P)/FAD-dependent oxidoreductase n=1 Tax=Infirmifilum sp. NZ TaxID=2926850 RepID=UPI00279C9ACB|nr:NAD(P)/FAD-dependent oxidoreductase [Infirmifilum sp. NZ]UNQ72731.1 NAD(P)/FAD-dependent oxidoreductase [Infirmifilum sp. NZ]